jgi:UDP-GlcNAc:undecaprenyl-phosphate GlcNAc-1-phosphate transferase
MMFEDFPAFSGLILFVSVLTAIVVCLNARAIGTQLGVMAHPDSVRKRHLAPTPQVGGIAILLALCAWLAGMLWSGAPLERPLLFALLACALGVGLVGFADDQREMTPFSRMLLLVVFLGIAFVVEPGFIAKTLNWSSFAPAKISLLPYCLLMIVTSVGLVNAVNMADGQNGVVGSMFAVWSGCLALVSTGTSQAAAVVLFLASLVFLVFNLRGKLFLGDCGTYGVTFVIGLLVALAHARGEVSLETVIVWFFVPVVDCLRLLITRPMRGRSPFEGDRDHIHHRLEDEMGRTKGYMTYAGAVASTSLLSTLEPKFALVSLTLVTAFYLSYARLTDNKADQTALSPEADAASVNNVVAISSTESLRRQENR